MGFQDWADQLREGAIDALEDDYNAADAAQAAQQRAQEARQSGSHEREKLADANDSLRAGHGYDPPSITQHENWMSLSHHQIYETNQSSLDERATNEMGKAWEHLGQQLRRIADALERRSTRAISSGWEGRAADAATTSVEPMVEWMHTSGEVFHLTGNKVRQAGSAAGQVKAMVAVPQDHDISQSIVTGLQNGPLAAAEDVVQQARTRQQAERAAQEAMERVYSGTYTDVDETVPAYRQLDGSQAPPPPVPPPHVPPVPVPIPPTGPDGGGGDPDSPERSGRDGERQRDGDHREGGDHRDRDGQRDRDRDGHRDRDGRVNPDGPPAETDPEWTDPTPGPGGNGQPGPGGNAQPGPGGRAPEGVRHGGGSPSGGHAGGAAGVVGGVGAGGARGGGLGSGGRSGSAPLGGNASGSSSSTTSSGSSGRGGARGMMPMRGAPGQEGEQDHERPSWLEEWDDVWFNDMPNTAPPVIGE